MDELILKAGEISKSIVTFIRDVRNKYNIPKDKLVLYIDTITKETEILDLCLINFDGIIIRLGKIETIEYSLFDLFDRDIFFETINISGYNIYIGLPNIQKESQINDFSDEINRLESQKNKYKIKLSDDKFVLKAPKNIVDVEFKKLKDTESKIYDIKANLLMLACGKEYYNLLLKLESNESILWQVQYYREQKSTKEKYEQDWFEEIYNPEISVSEVKELHSKICI